MSSLGNDIIRYLSSNVDSATEVSIKEVSVTEVEIFNNFVELTQRWT
jgi:hypothetical protein